MTHAFFKALLFLAAGSVIIGMHHQQDMRKMGGLRKYMPITFWTSLVGTLALVGTPFFSGFYSKDTIIEAAQLHAAEHADWLAQYAYLAVLLGAFVTSFYSFRLLYMTFFGEERFRDAHAHEAHAHEAHGDGVHAHDDHHDDHGHHGAHEPHEPHESPWVVTVPLVLLAIPSFAIGFVTIGPMLFATDMLGHEQQLPFFLGAIDVLKQNDVMARLAEEFHGPLAFALHGFTAPAFYLALMGFLLATLLYLVKPEWRVGLKRALALPIRVLEHKYWMDELWIGGFAGGGVGLGKLSRLFDSKVIDGVAVNGSAGVVGLMGSLARKLQSGYLYHYAFAMIIGLSLLLGWLLLRS
jgi:NADH-quinone oxidoreductase subunit L